MSPPPLRREGNIEVASHIIILSNARAKKKMENFMLSRGIINEFKEKFGSVNCIDLTGLDFAVDEDLGKWGDVYAEREKLAVNCHTYIDWAAERVLKTLNS